MRAREVRKLDPAHVNEVAASIGALGFCVPVLIGEDNRVLDGGARIQAARLLGLGYAPCLRIDHLIDDEQRLLRLAVDRLGEKGNGTSMSSRSSSRS
jgi:ParB-like chromosome segregation protein Spo0J